MDHRVRILLKRFLPGVIVVFSLFISTYPAFMAIAQGGVSLDIQVIYASMEKEYVDPTLIGLSEKLSRLFSYSSFEIISKFQRDAGMGEKSSFDIPGGRNLEIVQGGVKDGKVKLFVKIAGERNVMVKTALRVERGSIVMLGGPRYKEGVLIILISAD